jgi:hypothetical protein
MANLPWLDEVLKRLAKRGLPPSYVQRFAEELSDHLEDLTEENMSTEVDAYSRLGKPEHVADAAVVAYRRRSFLGRHPAAAFLVFGLSPLASLIALMATVSASLLALSDGWDKHLFAGLEQFGPSASVVAAYLGSLLIVVIPSILASALYCRLAGRLGVGKRWMLLSCTVLALAAALVVSTAKVSNTPGESWMRIGIWLPQSVGHSYSFFFWTFCRPQQLMHFLVPLAIGWWFMRHNYRRSQLSNAIGGRP